MNLREIGVKMNKWIATIKKFANFYNQYPDLIDESIEKGIPIKQIIERDEVKTIEQLKEVKEELREENQELVDQIEQLSRKLKKYEPSEEEKKYNNKYPKKKIYYGRHEIDGTYQIDVRDYFQINDSKLPDIKGDSDDEIALNSLKWVIDNIDYIPDKSS